MPDSREVGIKGEAAAARFLKKNRYRILHANLRLGRLGELDIVARDGGTLVFVEVKSRVAGQELGGFGNITAFKQRKLRDLGTSYLQKYGGDHDSVRFDAIEVEFTDGSLKRPEIRHLRDAFR